MKDNCKCQKANNISRLADWRARQSFTDTSSPTKWSTGSKRLLSTLCSGSGFNISSKNLFHVTRSLFRSWIGVSFVGYDIYYLMVAVSNEDRFLKLFIMFSRGKEQEKMCQHAICLLNSELTEFDPTAVCIRKYIFKNPVLKLDKLI